MHQALNRTSLTQGADRPGRLDLDQGLPGAWMFIYVAAHNRYSIGAQIKGIWAIGRVSPHRPLGSRNKMSLRKSKTRLIPSPRHVGLRAAPAAGPAAVHQFAHGRYGDRPKGRARDIVDFV